MTECRKVHLCLKSLNEVIEFLLTAVTKVVLHSVHELSNLQHCTD